MESIECIVEQITRIIASILNMKLAYACYVCWMLRRQAKVWLTNCVAEKALLLSITPLTQLVRPARETLRLYQILHANLTIGSVHPTHDSSANFIFLGVYQLHQWRRKEGSHTICIICICSSLRTLLTIGVHVNELVQLSKKNRLQIFECFFKTCFVAVGRAHRMLKAA